MFTSAFLAFGLGLQHNKRFDSVDAALRATWRAHAAAEDKAQANRLARPSRGTRRCMTHAAAALLS